MRSSLDAYSVIIMRTTLSVFHILRPIFVRASIGVVRSTSILHLDRRQGSRVPSSSKPQLLHLLVSWVSSKIWRNHINARKYEVERSKDRRRSGADRWWRTSYFLLEYMSASFRAQVARVHRKELKLRREGHRSYSRTYRSRDGRNEPVAPWMKLARAKFERLSWSS